MAPARERVTFFAKASGHEQHGDRFGVVVQADGLLPRSLVLVEQVGAVDVQRLDELSGHLSREEFWGVDDQRYETSADGPVDQRG